MQRPLLWRLHLRQLSTTRYPNQTPDALHVVQSLPRDSLRRCSRSASSKMFNAGTAVRSGVGYDKGKWTVVGIDRFGRLEFVTRSKPTGILQQARSRRESETARTIGFQ